MGYNQAQQTIHRGWTMVVGENRINRPIGVTIFAFLAAIEGIISLMEGLTLASLGGAVTKLSTQTGGTVTVIAGIFLLAAALFDLAFAKHAWTLRPKGWMLGLIAAELALVGAMLSMMQGASLNREIVHIAVAILFLYALTMPSVRKSFVSVEAALL